VEDNQQGLITSYYGLKALKDEGIVPEFSVGLIFAADEETHSVFGLRHVLEVRGDLFSPDDLIIVPDAGAPDGTMIEIAEKSSFWLKFTVRGRQCHASVPQLGINTMRASARLITAIDQMLNTTYIDRDELFRPRVSTFEPTKKEANVPNINTIPGEDIFYFDCRVLPHYDLDEIQANIQKEMDRIAEETGVTVRLDLVSKEKSPAATPMDSPVVKALTRAINTVHNRDARPMGIGGGTVAKFFRQKGLPAAVWSTTDATAHSPNEYCLLSNLVADAKIFAHVYLGL
jgi:succinyl-diaminopimelate desuccinylase